MIKFYDTNYLLELNDNLFSDLKEGEMIFTSSICLEEIEHIKESRNKSEEIKYKARRVARQISENFGKLVVIVYDDMVAKVIKEHGISEPNNDVKICGCAAFINNDEIVFYTNDINCRIIANTIFELQTKNELSEKENIYKGYKIITGSIDEITEKLSNKEDWTINEYAVIKYDDGTEKEMRFNGDTFVSLKLPNSKYIKGKNALQRCALDALLNQDITVVALLGTYGSGKTYLAMQMGLHAIREKGTQSKLLGVREIIGEGKEPGFLPGTLDDKIGAFFEPLVHSLSGGIFELEGLKQSGVLETAIPHFMKGTTYNDTIIICDEAEDLSKSQLRLIGTRLGENSRIFFSGDYKQSLINKTNNNALVEMCESFKGQPNFACVCLDTDVRSDTSRMFAELFTD